MFRRRSKTRQAVDTVADVSTNPAVPVGGAAGLALLGAALIRRRRQKARSVTG